MKVIGIDIGGSGIKGAPVDPEGGRFIGERLRVATPRPATPEVVAAEVGKIVAHFGGGPAVGVTFPGPIVDGVIGSAANLGDAWIGVDGRELFGAVAGVPVTLVNDADAAGVAEMAHGAGRGRRGTVVMLTLGTGIGSALFTDGTLMPNTELGHLEVRGKDAEARASARARKDRDWSWEKWAGHVAEYLRTVERLLTPSLFIIGGGVSRKAERFFPYLDGVRTPVVPAELHNDAGIIGAAMLAGR